MAAFRDVRRAEGLARGRRCGIGPRRISGPAGKSGTESDSEVLRRFDSAVQQRAVPNASPHMMYARGDILQLIAILHLCNSAWLLTPCDDHSGDSTASMLAITASSSDSHSAGASASEAFALPVDSFVSVPTASADNTAAHSRAVELTSPSSPSSSHLSKQWRFTKAAKRLWSTLNICQGGSQTYEEAGGLSKARWRYVMSRDTIASEIITYPVLNCGSFFSRVNLSCRQGRPDGVVK